MTRIHMAVRSTASRTVLFVLGLAGMAAGVVFLLGMRPLKARISEVWLGIGGIFGGLALMKIAMTADQTTTYK